MVNEWLLVAFGYLLGVAAAAFAALLVIGDKHGRKTNQTHYD
jgi:gas vesicle protein